MTEPSTSLGQELSWEQEVERTTAFWQRLGLPGLLDVHTHFLPPPVQAKVWEQFDNAGPKLGREWPIRYRGSVEERVAQLRALGVRRFSTLPYAHRPGIARYLNEWAAGFKRDVPESLWSATLYPEDDVASLVEAVGHQMIALGSDYPHAEGMAEPRDFQKQIAHLPAEQQRWILRDNGFSLVGG